jgi:hypothetical protein
MLKLNVDSLAGLGATLFSIRSLNSNNTFGPHGIQQSASFVLICNLEVPFAPLDTDEDKGNCGGCLLFSRFVNQAKMIVNTDRADHFLKMHFGE